MPEVTENEGQEVVYPLENRDADAKGPMEKKNGPKVTTV